MGTEYVYMFKNDEERLLGAQWVEENTDINGMRYIEFEDLLGVCTCISSHAVFPVTAAMNQIESDVKLDTIEEFAEQVFILSLEK